MKTSHALIAATLIGCLGCQYELPSRPVLGYEFDDAACSDGVDNDQDQLTDCEDPDCLVGSTHCGEQVPVIPDGRPERGLLCRDQIDNDENGQFDCGDPACREQLENCCVLEFSDEACSDGIDNDQNGFADCEDFSCRQGIFVTVCFEGDRATCSDGRDNDGDGDIDCADSSCSREPTCSDACEGLEEGAEDTLARCTDGCDNDGNGYTDCDDRSCALSQDPAVVQACTPDRGPENTLVAPTAPTTTTTALLTAMTLAAPEPGPSDLGLLR